jgi:purine-binding chemotaxis protein CheW
VTIAGNRVALRASVVEAVVELDTLIPVPRAAPHIAGLSALRSRVLTVIDCKRSLDLGETRRGDGPQEAVVVDHDGHHYALEVDTVEDVIDSIGEPTPIRAALGWERIALGLVETAAGPLLLVDIAGLIAGPEQRSVAAAA